MPNNGKRQWMPVMFVMNVTLEVSFLLLYCICDGQLMANMVVGELEHETSSHNWAAKNGTSKNIQAWKQIGT